MFRMRKYRRNLAAVEAAPTSPFPIASLRLRPAVLSCDIVLLYLTMSDDEADPELLELLRSRLGITRRNPDEVSSDTGGSTPASPFLLYHLLILFDKC